MALKHIYRSIRNRKLRVLLVAPTPPPVGGIATWALMLLERAKNYPDLAVKNIDVAVRWKSILNRSQLVRILGGSIQAMRDILRIAAGIIRFKPDVLHIASTAGYASLRDILLAIVCNMLGPGVLIHYHTSRIAHWRRDRLTWHERATLIAMRLAKKIMVLDEGSRTLLKEFLPENKIKIIPNMIALEAIDKIVQNVGRVGKAPTETHTNLVFVGHVVPEKGLVEMVQACSELNCMHLHVIGPVLEGFCKYLKGIARLEQTGQWLHFYGAVSKEEAYSHILRNDIMLLPSHDEAFPYVLLEGMALKKPVLVSDVGAMKEIADCGSANPCGICVEPRNVDSLRDGLRRLLSDPGSWERMGSMGRSRVEALYSPDKVMPQWISLWAEVGRQDL